MSENDKNIEKGKFHEKNFTEFLNNCGISYLYIKQNPQDEYHSEVLKESKTKRPDLLLYLPIIGHIFIDVKSRYTIEDLCNEHRFYLLCYEIDSLFSCQSYFFLPVFIAFVSTKKGDNKDFYLVPISILKIYKDKLKQELGKDCNLLDYLYIRIPNTFLKNIEDSDSFIATNNSYNFNNIKSEAEKYKKLDENIINIINDMKENNKNDVKEYCVEKNIEYVKVSEILRKKEIDLT